MSTAAAKQTMKPDMTRATPVTGEKIEVPAFDTTTPVEQDVMPFTQIFLAKWGRWLLARLQQHWPHFTEFNYRGIMSQHMSQNGCIFIKAKRAILLAASHRDAFEPRPIVKIIFLFKFDPDDKDQNKDAKLLYRRVEEWAKNIGAQYIRVENTDAVDVIPSVLKTWGNSELSYLAKDLDK